MIERPIEGLNNGQPTAQFHTGLIKSEFFEGSGEELYSCYLRYRLLYELGRLVTSQTQIDRIIDILLDKLIDLTGAERCLVLIFNDQNQVLYQVGRNLKHEEISAPAFEVSWSIIEKAKQRCAPVCLRNALENGEFKASKSVHRLKILSVLCMPVLYEGMCIGVLYADNRTVQGIFREDTCSLFRQLGELISGQLAAALQRKELENHILNLSKHLHSRAKYHSIIGTSPQIRQVLQFIDQVAATSATVIIEGESGVGKELVAKALHENSKRCTKPFVSLNCGALTETLLESELFGHVKGAFTGASRDKKGWFETANGGTIFFDEISEMSTGLQVKLLRILQTGEFSPVGSNEIKTCDVRIIAATNQHLEDLVKAGKFRSDLYYRLNILYLYIPPLRERREDIPLLATYYLHHYSQQLGKESLRLSREVRESLLRYEFPGNIRELENAMQRSAVLAEEQEVQLRHLPDSFRPLTVGQGAIAPRNFAEAKRGVVEKFERDYIEKTLQESNGIVARAAKLAGMDAKNFCQKMARYKIRGAAYKKGA